MMMTNEMTAKERVMAAVYRRPVDRIPAITPTSVANIECMKAAKVSFPQAHIDAYAMAQLAATGHTVLGFDSVMPYFSVHLEAEALGCEVYWDSNTTMPIITSRPIHNSSNFDLPPSFLSHRACKNLLRAIKLLKKQFGDSVAIIGKVIGPWSLAYNLYGIENLILDSILEPQKTKRFIQDLLQVPLAFAQAQFEAGADIITWADHVTADLISAEMYREFVFPFHQMAVKKLAKYGPMILHTCGNVMDRLNLIRETGFTCFHIDSRNDLPEAVKIASHKIVLTGSINNPSTLTAGTPADVRNEVLFNLQSGISLISPECAIPFHVTNQNLKELVHTAHKTV